MLARAALGLLAAAALALGAGCGGGEKVPFRIGVLADCYGVFSSVHDVIVASAELPLLERGAELLAVASAGPLERLEGGLDAVSIRERKRVQRC